MNQPKATRTVQVENPLGIHIRPAVALSNAAKQFRSRASLLKDRQRADVRSVLEMLSLGVKCGDQVVLEAIGEDAQAAVDALAGLFLARFDEDDA